MVVFLDFLTVRFTGGSLSSTRLPRVSGTWVWEPPCLQCPGGSQNRGGLGELPSWEHTPRGHPWGLSRATTWPGKAESFLLGEGSRPGETCRVTPSRVTCLEAEAATRRGTRWKSRQPTSSSERTSGPRARWVSGTLVTAFVPRGKGKAGEGNSLSVRLHPKEEQQPRRERSGKPSQSDQEYTVRAKKAVRVSRRWQVAHVPLRASLWVGRHQREAAEATGTVEPNGMESPAGQRRLASPGSRSFSAPGSWGQAESGPGLAALALRPSGRGPTALAVDGAQGGARPRGLSVWPGRRWLGRGARRGPAEPGKLTGCTEKRCSQPWGTAR